MGTPAAILTRDGHATRGRARIHARPVPSARDTSSSRRENTRRAISRSSRCFSGRRGRPLSARTSPSGQRRSRRGPSRDRRPAGSSSRTRSRDRWTCERSTPSGSRAARGREFRRGFELGSGERVLVVDDIMTTGGSVQETIDAVRGAGAQVVGAAVLVDRSGGAASLDVPLHALWTVDIPAYRAWRLPTMRGRRAGHEAWHDPCSGGASSEGARQARSALSCGWPSRPRSIRS